MARLTIPIATKTLQCIRCNAEVILARENSVDTQVPNVRALGESNGKRK